jgi:hypothetical protein
MSQTHEGTASAPAAEPLPEALEAAAALAYKANDLRERGRAQAAREKNEAALAEARQHCEPDSLILAQLLMAAHVTGHQEAKQRSEAAGLDYAGVGALEEAVAILQRRHAAGTLVPSTPLEHRFRVRSALELVTVGTPGAFGVRLTGARAGAPAPSAASPRRPFGGGYNDVICACTFLFKRLIRASAGSYDPITRALLPPPAELQLPYATQQYYKAFTLAGLDLMAEMHADGSDDAWSAEELTLIHGLESTFGNAVSFIPGTWAAAAARKFGEGRFAALSGVAGGGGGAQCIQLADHVSARVRELDVARHGLQRCALPSCAHAPETFPREFKRCGACNHASAAYCCKDHQVAHWHESHKKACSRQAAAQSAA